MMAWEYIPSRFMLQTSHYDKEKADRAVLFIQNLCHTKGKWAGKKFLLLPRILRPDTVVVNQHGPSRQHQNIIWTDIQVEKAVLMKRLQSVQNLFHYLSCPEKGPVLFLPFQEMLQILAAMDIQHRIAGSICLIGI